ncbi:MAG TPA: AI-2E family transporter, partial [Puia sp.]|nr:AI-2E family transporter [Puia sp.]
MRQSTPFYTRVAMVLITLISLFYIAVLGKSILAPLLFGLLFAVLLLPLANLLERSLRLPRSIASLLSVVFLILALAGLLYVVGAQIGNLADDWPQFKQQVSSSVTDL